MSGSWDRSVFPIVYGAPIGHTKRPMLTDPRWASTPNCMRKAEGTLEILEIGPAVVLE